MPHNIGKLKGADRPKARKDYIMNNSVDNIIDCMDSVHGASVRNLCYTLGGKPLPIIEGYAARIGEKNPLADMLGIDGEMTLNDAADGAYWELVKYAKELYFGSMARETALAIASGITPCGTLRLANDVEFTDLAFVNAWNKAHPSEQCISWCVDIG